MKNFIFLIIILLGNLAFAQAPNDCVNYIQACGNQGITLDVKGGGKEEIRNKGCGSEEHHSLWLRVTIEEAGTLGFTLKPDSQSIYEDYDFWVFGPNVDCNNLPMAIRCSTTNPEAAGQTNNWTGMNGTETDKSEGPGQYGNSFVKWLDVAVGESYFIVLDRPIGNSSFTLQWTGTAKLDNPLEDVVINKISNKQVCDVDADGLVNFNFTNLVDEIIDDATGMDITFHKNESDAFTGNNPIGNNTPVSSGTYYYRVENTGSGCFEINSFSLYVSILEVKSPEVTLCDKSVDSSEFVDLTQYEVYNDPNAVSIQYYLSESAAIKGGNDFINKPESFEITSNNTIIYARVIDNNGCVGIAKVKFKFKIPPASVAINSHFCKSQISDGLALKDFEHHFITNDNEEVEFFTNQTDLNDNNAISSNVIYPEMGTTQLLVKVSDNNCSNISTWHVHVHEDIDIEETEELKLCAAEFPYTITFEQPFDAYEWDDGTKTNSITIQDYGEYTITVTNDIGCTDTKTYKVKESPLPIIQDVIIDENGQVNVVIEGDTSGFEYQLNDGAWQSSPIFQQEIKGIYNLKVRTPKGCIVETNGFTLPTIYNFITPNGDGLNDLFDLTTIELGDARASLDIYDRYGKKIFTAHDGDALVWDGKYNGRIMPTGTYYYILKIEPNHVHTGYITLKSYRFE